jgi:hypothetical protein
LFALLSRPRWIILPRRASSNRELEGELGTDESRRRHRWKSRGRGRARGREGDLEGEREGEWRWHTRPRRRQTLARGIQLEGEREGEWRWRTRPRRRQTLARGAARANAAASEVPRVWSQAAERRPNWLYEPGLVDS